MLFVGIAILHEISKLQNISKDIQKQLEWFRAFLFTTFVFPCSYGLMTIFWIIWSFDRELVFPAVIDTVLPPWVNYSLHAFILIPSTIEFLISKNNHSFKISAAAKILVPFIMLYQTL